MTEEVRKSLEDKINILIFTVRMRVAYRRDYIKLRNRSLYTKPLVEHQRLSFLIIETCTRYLSYSLFIITQERDALQRQQILVIVRHFIVVLLPHVNEVVTVNQADELS